MSDRLVRIEALREVMESRGLNASDLGRLTGKQPSYFYGLLAGSKSFGEKIARSLEEDLGLPRGHLDGGDRAAQDSVVETGQKRSRVPLVEWGKWSPSPGGETTICPVAHGPDTIAVAVVGDSMDAPTGRRYPAGTIVYIDPSVSPSDGRAVLAELKSGERTLKIFREGDGERWLMPLHPQYPSIRKPFSVIGVVIGSFTPEPQ